MRIDRFNRTLGALIVLALVAGCSNPSTTTSQSSSESSSAAGQTIKIGMDLPLSGGDASNGIPTRNGAMLAIEDANAKTVPGGFKFAAYDLDDAVQGKHDPGQGAQNVKSFVADSATLAMLGPFNSNVARAEIPVTNDAGMAQISPSNTNTALTTPPESIKLRPSHPDVNTFFRVCTRDDKQGAANAQYARKLGYKRAFIVDDNETYGKGLADVFDATFTKLGGTVLAHEHLTSGQTDYKALLTKGQALKPDVVFYGGTSVTGGGLLRKQMADAGMGTLPFFGGDGISDAEFLSIAGSAANGAVYTVRARARCFEASVGCSVRCRVQEEIRKRRRTVQRERVHDRRDRNRRDREGHHGEQERASLARGRARERRGDQRFRLADRLGRLR